jgi:Inositol phospholipid synthesis and fat-storage-inducing TM
VVVPFSPSIDGLGDAPGIDGLIGGKEGGVLLSVPIEYCHTRTTITPDLHPHLLFSSSSSPTIQSYGRPSGLYENLEEAWKEAVRSWKGGRARLYKGHDVSGHIFLLTLCILFLTDQVVGVLYPPSHIPAGVKAGTMRGVRGPEAWAFRGTLALLALWWWMAIMTSVYFHTPQEKLSGFRECWALSVF